MITIELDISTILVAVISSTISTAISVAATWHFSKRHYTREARPLTQADIQMQEAKNEFRLWVLFGIVFGAIVAGFVAVLILMVVLI